MTRMSVLLAALVIAAPASAATYAGKPVAPGAEARLVTRNIVWNQVGATYQGRTEESRPVVLCQSLARRVGRLESFTVDGRALAGAALARCNASAPPVAAPSLSAAR